MRINYFFKKHIIFTLLVIILYAIFIFFHQQRIQKNAGLGWDGVFYNSIYEVFKGEGGQTDKILQDFNYNTYDEMFNKGEPFNQRIGVPYLASILKMDKFLAFSVINLSAFFIGIFLFINKWKSKIFLAIIFTFYLMLTPQIPFRFSLFYPISVEGGLFLFLFLVIVFYNKPNVILFLTILFLPFKEGCVLIGIVYFISLLINNIAKRKFNIILLLFKITFLVIIYFFYKKILQYYFNVELESHGIKTIFFWINQNIYNPIFYIRLIACFFVVFSGFSIFYFKKIAENRIITQKFLFIFILAPILVFSGSDITRILCIILPFLFDDILDLNLSNQDYLWLLFCFLLFLPLKFPFLNLEFSDNQNIGEGFFLTQPEYLKVRYNLYYIIYSMIMILILYSSVFNKYILNNDKILRLTKNKSSMPK